MHDAHDNPARRTPSARSMIGWGVAVLVVIGAWIAVLDLRAGQGGQKQVMAGWQDGLAAGQRMAAEQDRSMIVLFTASWCGPCQRFKGAVLHDAGVEQLLSERFVPVQVDLSDRSRDNPNNADAQRYHVQGIPTLLAMDAQGQVIGQYPIMRDSTPDDFANWLDRVPRQARLDVSSSSTAGSR